MGELNIDISEHRSKDLNDVNLTDYDPIVAMSPRIAQYLTSVRNIPEHRVRVLDIPDPYGKGLTAYRQCLAELQHALSQLFPHGHENERPAP